MLLRRFMKGLRDRDWGVVAMEIAIVVIGVFIALQVSNWNDDRKDALRGQDYLLRMQNELRGDAQRIETMVAFWRSVNAQGIAALEHAEHGKLHQGSAWKTVLAYYQASQIWPYRKSDTTFQEIRASGEFGLIRDPVLRARISEHYAGGPSSAVAEVLGVIPAYRERIRGMTPWAIQQHVWANCYSGASAVQQLVDCDAPITEAEAHALLESFASSPELVADLRFWMATNGLGITLLEAIRRDAAVLAEDMGGQ